MIYAFDINKLDVVCKNAKIIILTDSVKYHTAKFKFSEDWEHFSKTAYFINKSNDKDEKDISVPMFLGGNETVCLIPWEVLTREGQLIVSIQGVQDDTEIWTKMNRPIVLQKSDKDSDTMPQEPTIPIYNQLLNKLDSKGDSIQFEDDTLSLKSGNKVLSTTKIKDASQNIDLLTNILNNAIINKEENQLVVTSVLNNETGRNNLKTIGTDNSLKIENEELSVNTNSLDISNSNITYDDTTTTLKNFVDVVNKTFTNIENNQTSTIVKATNTTPYIELSTSGRYDVATNGTILIKEPNTKETTELYVTKGDVIYVSTYGTSDTGQVLHHIDFIRLYSGDGINNLGIEYHKIAYNESKQKIINERKELTHSIETFWDMITPLLEIQKDQLISSEGIDDETGIPKFKVISLGMGLKLENNVLSLDIANGDNLKYGTSTQSTEINEKESGSK